MLINHSSDFRKDSFCYRKEDRWGDRDLVGFDRLVLIARLLLIGRLVLIEPFKTVQSSFII